VDAGGGEINPRVVINRSPGVSGRCNDWGTAYIAGKWTIYCQQAVFER